MEMENKLSQEMLDIIENLMSKIIRDYHIYGMSGIAEIPDPNLSQVVDMLHGLKGVLGSLEVLHSKMNNTGIVNSLINAQQKILLASRLLDAVKAENREDCEQIMAEIKNQR
ncbi:hypothetical protein ACFGZQ_03585 [Pasteurella multocida]